MAFRLPWREARVLAPAVTWHAEHRVLLNGNPAVVFQ
jgi:formyltetrahydrofolate hydrolase